MLEVKNLKARGLQSVSFALAAGECVAVQGPSGAGKSLLLRAIADLDPNSGVIVLDGEERDAMPAHEWRRRAGYLPAEPGWWADQVGNHFKSWDAVAPLVQFLGFPDEARSWPVTRLSTGERIRLALIRALSVRPKILLLDEPTASLDPFLVSKAEALIADECARGLGVLWVTHDAAQAAKIATRSLVIDRGRVTEVIAA